MTIPTVTRRRLVFRRMSRLLLLSLFSLLATAFTWGEPEDSCRTARTLVDEYDKAADPTIRADLERQILKLCPDGAPAQYVIARRHERNGDAERAAGSYREVLRIDPSFSRAAGNLGLLLLERGETDAAAVELSKGLQGGNDPRYHRGLAAVFTARHVPSLALYHADEALRSFPDDPLLLRQRARALAEMGKRAEALAQYRLLLGRTPSDDGLVLEAAETLDGAGDSDGAIEILKGAAASAPGKREIHRRLHALYEKKGDLEKADYEAVLAGLPPRRKPNLLEETRKEADRLLAAKEYEGALAAYRNVLKEKPEDHESRRRAASILAQTGREDEAIAELREIIRLKGEGGAVYADLARLYEKKGLHDEAIVAYRNALRFPDADQTLRVSLADLYESRGSYPQGIDQLRAFLSTHPEDLPAQLRLARLFIKNRQVPEAIDAYRKLTAQSPDHLEARQELAALFWKLKKNDEAEKEYREVLRLKKDDQEARRVLTSIYAKQKNYDRLVELLTESIELDPNDAGNHYKLGLVHEFSRRYEKAMESYQRAVELKDDHAKAFNAMGRVAMKLGRLSEAKGYLERAREIDPEMEETTVLLSNIRDEFSESRLAKGKKKKKEKGKGKKGKKSRKKSTKTKKSSVKGSGAKSKGAQ